MSAAPAPAPPGRGRWRYAALGGWVLAADAWFQGPLLGGRVGASLGAWLLLAVLVVSVVRAVPKGRPRPSLFVLTVTAMLFLATLVRLPAILAPGSLITSDSAVAGIIAQELRDGQTPGPIYAPGFPYEGTLKPHLTALAGRALPFVGTPALYLLASHAFFLVWMIAVMALARRVGGLTAALGAGLFLAVSPRFLAAFSLNNVGQYAEVNALGAASLALLASGGGPLLAGFLVGLALWQQLVAVSFVAVLAAAVLATPRWRSARGVAEAVVGLGAGSYAVWLWNAAHGWATFDFFRRGGKNPWERLAGVPDRLERTASVSFPKLFGLSDLDVTGPAAALLGLVLPALVLAMTWTRRREILQDRGRSAVFLAATLFLVTLGVFVVSKFSHRGVQRPRYLIALYTPVAVAVGWAAAALGRRSPPLAGAALGGLLLVNAAGLVPWLRARGDAEARDDVFLGRLSQLGARTGYSGFWVAPKYTFLSEGALVLSGELGPDVSWVHRRHAEEVRERGPDVLVTGRGTLAEALSGRLRALGVAYQKEDVAGHAVFYGLSRTVTLEELSGYDSAVPPALAGSGDTPDSAAVDHADTTS
ncbi:MAG TPA: hypothetical protein VMT87_00685 [Vicinamibacteria bacterium]|nr:hypothetical protein [Vicinamibacteria bacterium]